MFVTYVFDQIPIILTVLYSIYIYIYVWFVLLYDVIYFFISRCCFYKCFTIPNSACVLIDNFCVTCV